MTQNIRVHRNSISIDGRNYEVRGLGGGRFNVLDSSKNTIGSFAVRGRTVEAEDLKLEGADPVEQIGQLWVRENLSAAPAAPARPPEPPPPKPSEPIAIAPLPAPPPPKPAEPAPDAAAKPGQTTPPICRIVTHEKPDRAAFQKAIAYTDWLRTQDGVVAAYLTHDPDSGKTMSITIWVSKEKLTQIRYAKPPEGATPLKAASVELLWVAQSR